MITLFFKSNLHLIVSNYQFIHACSGKKISFLGFLINVGVTHALMSFYAKKIENTFRKKKKFLAHIQALNIKFTAMLEKLAKKELY